MNSNHHHHGTNTIQGIMGYMKSYYMALNLEASEIIACLHNKG